MDRYLLLDLYFSSIYSLSFSTDGYLATASEGAIVSFVNNEGNSFDIQLIDQLGRVIMSHNNIQSIGSNMVNVDLTNLSDGIYSIQLKSDQNTISKRLIVRK
jgi:hypothetical protein